MQTLTPSRVTRNVTVALLMGLCGASWAQTAPAAAREFAARPAMRSDQQFMAEAAQNENAEIQVAMIALRRASNVQARSIAQALLQDHCRLEQELQALSVMKAIPLPGDPSTPKRHHIDTLEHVGRAAFDRHYAEAMVMSDQQSIMLFRQAARHAQDADVRAWAKASLPVLEHHLQMARYLKAAL